MAYRSRPQAATTTSTVTPGTLEKDFAFPADATDTISSIRWSPVTSCLAAASWDGKVRVYDVTRNSNIVCVASINSSQPVLSCDFNEEGTTVVAAGADKKIHLLGSGAGPDQSMTFPAHDSPIRAVRFVKASFPAVASGSWDKKLHLWDLRNTSKPVFTHDLKARVYAMDTAGSLLVAATATKKLHIIDLTNHKAMLRTQDSPLTHQITAVATCPTGQRWTTASIEGRMALSHMNEEKDQRNFTWRCHRFPAAQKNTKDVFAVNTTCFSPKDPDIVATGGSDGSFIFWDISTRCRLMAFPALDDPVTACEFNHDGKLFAYATGYDWARGYNGSQANRTTSLRIHPVAETDVVKKDKKDTRGY